MHESVVTLQELITHERDAVRALAERLGRAHQHDVTLINHAQSEEVRRLTEWCDHLEALISEYDAAAQGGQAADAALKLALIQYAAATMVAAAGRGEVVPDGR